MGLAVSSGKSRFVAFRERRAHTFPVIFSHFRITTMLINSVYTLGDYPSAHLMAKHAPVLHKKELVSRCPLQSQPRHPNESVLFIGSMHPLLYCARTACSASPGHSVPRFSSSAARRQVNERPQEVDTAAVADLSLPFTGGENKRRHTRSIEGVPKLPFLCHVR